MPNASSWNNGYPDHQTGSGFGLHIDSQYQPTVFSSNYNTIDIYQNNQLVAKAVNVSNKSCKELIDVQIGLWLINNSQNTWPTGTPYRFTMTQRGATNVFDIV